MQDILNDEDCEELDPGSGSVHAGNPTRKPPTSLPLQSTTGQSLLRAGRIKMAAFVRLLLRAIIRAYNVHYINVPMFSNWIADANHMSS